MHAPNGINVMLTGTSNEYLAPYLPVEGELEILETGTDGRIIHALFRRRQGGGLNAPVEVPAAEFAYAPPAEPEIPKIVNFVYYLHGGKMWEGREELSRQVGFPVSDALLEKIGQPFYEVALRCQLDVDTGAVTILGVE